MNNNLISYSSSPFLVFEKIDSKQIIINNLLLNQRQVISNQLLEIYKMCKTAATKLDICTDYGEEIFSNAVSSEIILKTDKIWAPLVFENVEIEISTICNYKCEYCPVRYDPKKPRIMNMRDFTIIIEKISQIPSIKNVSLSSYNEPLLDPYFKERVSQIKKYGLSLILHTNGSKLDRNMVDYLKSVKCVNEIHVNFPCYDSQRYYSITGSNTFDTVCENLEYAIEAGLNINFSIQKIGDDYKNNLKLMNQVYAERLGKKIVAWETVDRAGILNNEYAQAIYIPGLLSGCKNVLKWLTINVNGDCFVCCNDYYNHYCYGNIIKNSLIEITNSTKYSTLLKNIFGETNPNESFICRKCYEMKIMHTYKRFEKPIKRKLNLLESDC